MGRLAPAVALLLTCPSDSAPSQPATPAAVHDAAVDDAEVHDAAVDDPAVDDAHAHETPASPLTPTGRLQLDARWPLLVSPIGSTLDGRGFIGGVGHELVVHDGTREVQRLGVMATRDDGLAALADGRWQVGPRVLEADGRMRFDGHAWCNRVGRFGACQAAAFSPDGTVAILAASDSPSTCLRDRGCDAGSWRGTLARLTFAAQSGAPTVRVLDEHEDRRDFVVAASTRAVAAAEGRALRVWPAQGDGDPTTATLEGTMPSRLAWAGDHLVVSRWVDTEHAELEVLDGAKGYARAARWPVEGTIEAIAIRPDGQEIAIGTTWYRARATVEVDEKRVEIHGLDGSLRARIDVDGWPTSLAWSPDGAALLVAVFNRAPGAPHVARYTR
jgi:hypothetical protein